MSDGIDPIIIRLGVDTTAAAESIKEFDRQTKAVLETNLGTSVDKARQKIDDLVRKFNELSKTVDADKQKLEELRQKREQVAGDSLKKTDQEIEGTKKVIAAREVEIINIQRKKLQLEETLSLSAAGSSQEEAAVRKATQARLVELNVLKDQTRAQSQVTESIQQSDSALQGYMNRFLGFAGVALVIRQVSAAMQEQTDQLERAIAAQNKLHDSNKGGFDAAKPFLSEMGLTGVSDQLAAQKFLFGQSGVQEQYGVESAGTVGGVAAAIAPTLKAQGIKWDSAQARGLIGTGSLFADRGLLPENVRDFTADQLSANKNLTGDQLNQGLSNVVAVAGSPARSNALLGAWRDFRTQFQRAGLGFTDVEKMFTSLAQQGVPQEEIPSVLGKAAQAEDRLLGLNRDERQTLAEHFAESGAGSLTSQMMKSGPIDIQKFSKAVLALPAQKRDEVAREFAGPRGVAAFGSLAGYSGVQLPTGSPLAPSQNPVVQGTIRQQTNEVESSLRNIIPPGETDFDSALKSEEDALAAHPSRLPYYRRGIMRYVANTVSLGLLSSADQRIAGAKVYQRRAIDIARTLEAAANGQINISAEEKAKLQSDLSQIANKMGDPLSNPEMQALAQGSFTKNDTSYTRAGVLGAIGKTDESEQAWIDSHLPQGAEKSNRFLDSDAASSVFGESRDVLNSIRSRMTKPAPTTRPTTQPSSPVSINYHNNIINYGYSSSDVGGQESFNERYS